MSSYHNRRAEAGEEKARHIADLLAAGRGARFASPIARDLFALGAEAMDGVAFPVANELTTADATRNRIAAEDNELASEGRVKRNTRADRNGP